MMKPHRFVLVEPISRNMFDRLARTAHGTGYSVYDLCYHELCKITGAPLGGMYRAAAMPDALRGGMAIRLYPFAASMLVIDAWMDARSDRNPRMLARLLKDELIKRYGATASDNPELFQTV